MVTQFLDIYFNKHESLVQNEYVNSPRPSDTFMRQ